MSEMDAPRALVSRPLVKGNEALGTRLGHQRPKQSGRIKGVLEYETDDFLSFCSEKWP